MKKKKNKKRQIILKFNQIKKEWAWQMRHFLQESNKKKNVWHENEQHSVAEEKIVRNIE